ncbi:unnamed protein product [Urochloa humidicola]
MVLSLAQVLPHGGGTTGPDLVDNPSMEVEALVVCSSTSCGGEEQQLRRAERGDAGLPCCITTLQNSRRRVK